MCLAVPGKIVDIYEEDGLRMGKLDFGGLVRKACLQYVPEARVGQYALIHVGFALAVIEEEEAARTLEALTAITDPFHELGPETSDEPPRTGGDHAVRG